MSGILGTILGMFLAVTVVHDLVSHECLRATHCALLSTVQSDRTSDSCSPLVLCAKLWNASE